MASLDNQRNRVGRRRFLAITAGGLVYLAVPRRARAAQYAVGVNTTAKDPYAATIHAIEATGEWSPSLVSGKKVLIKPNLVAALSANTGTTTDPQVVRAIVDKSLANGAAQVMIIEGFPGSNNFSVCGYDFFQSYDPQGRVSLVDLSQLPNTFSVVPNGLAYGHIYMPELLLEENTFLISAAKMKVHAQSLVTLSVKNVFGLPPDEHYRLPVPDAVGRFAMHERGVHQAIIDMNLIRSADFAVVDAIWAMEGTGPWGGSPVRMDTVIAGRNATAVDRVCLAAMGIKQHWVHHLTYATSKGLGPPHLPDIVIKGDPLMPKALQLPKVPPMVNLPEAFPATFVPKQGDSTTIAYWLNAGCYARVEIVKTSDTSTQITKIRQLHNWLARTVGINTVTWDGRNDEGAIVEPDMYTIRVEVTYGNPPGNAFATGKVIVVDA